MKSAEEFYKTYLGGGYDYDGAYGLQCVDGAKIWMDYFLGSSIPTSNGWADGYAYYNRAWFTDRGCKWISDTSKLKDGDLLIWGRGSSAYRTHVAMYYHGKVFGMNQHDDTYGNYFSLVSWPLDIIGAWRAPNCKESQATKKTKKKNTKKKTYKDFYKEVLHTTKEEYEQKQAVDASIKQLDIPPFSYTYTAKKQTLPAYGLYGITELLLNLSLFLAVIFRRKKR